jgi:hypothetical protein
MMQFGAHLRLIALCLVSTSVALANAAGAQGAASAQAALDALDPAGQSAQAITAAAILKGCKDEFAMRQELLSALESVFVAYDSEKGEGEAAALIDEGSVQMSAGEGCANLQTAFKDGIYADIFLELAE